MKGHILMKTKVNEINPLITVAIPTLNRPRYLKEALESVLQQDCDNLEIVISDNFSSDETSKYLESIVDNRIRVFRQTKRISMVSNWNFCLKMSRGEYFLLLSDDDILGPNALRSFVVDIMQYRELNMQIPLLYGRTVVIDSDGHEIISFRQPNGLKIENGSLFINSWLRGKRKNVSLCSTLFNTASLESLGGFPEDVGYAADAAAIGRLSFINIAYVSGAMAYYRYHSINESNLTYSKPSIRLKSHLSMMEFIQDGLSSVSILQLRRAKELFLRRTYLNDIVYHTNLPFSQIIYEYRSTFPKDKNMVFIFFRFIIGRIKQSLLLKPIKLIWRQIRKMNR
jgi:glycosyltransferase involved in cell wall biosynthesis